MRPGVLFALAAAAATLTAPVALAPAMAAAQAQRDWTRTIVATPEGGFRMGNPAATLKVVEFVSLTCPHCRNFSIGGQQQLIENYVRGGRVSYELRSHVLNPVDEVAAVLNRCAAPAAYFALNDAILSEQPTWFGRLETLTRAEYEAIDSLPDARRLPRIAALTGLDAIAARHGVTASRARQCLTSPARLARVRSVRDAANREGVQGTPTFTINGRIARDAYDWATLEPLLGAAR